MFARMATFEVDDPALIDGEIATTRRYTERGRLPDGIPAVGFFMMVDRASGRVVEVLLFETEDDLRQGDATMSAMAPGEGLDTPHRSRPLRVPVHIPGRFARVD